MIKRTVTETICEYDKEGKLVKKTVTETHEEEDNTILTYPWNTPDGTHDKNWWQQPYVTWSNGTNGDEAKPISTTTTTTHNDY